MGKMSDREAAEVFEAGEGFVAVDDHELLERLATVAARWRESEQNLEAGVWQAREAGVTWSALAVALGMSPSEVAERYGHASAR